MLIYLAACSFSAPTTPASAPVFDDIVEEPSTAIPGLTGPEFLRQTPEPTPTPIAAPRDDVYSACVLLADGTTPPSPFTVEYAIAYTDQEPMPLMLVAIEEIENLWCAGTGDDPVTPRGMALVVNGKVARSVREVRVYTIDGDYADASLIEGSTADRAIYELRIPGVQELADAK